MQAALFHSIRPLFANKPLLIVANKTDAVSPDSLSDADKAQIAEMGRTAARASNPGAGEPAVWSVLRVISLISGSIVL